MSNFITRSISIPTDVALFSVKDGEVFVYVSPYATKEFTAEMKKFEVIRRTEVFKNDSVQVRLKKIESSDLTIQDVTDKNLEGKEISQSLLESTVIIFQHKNVTKDIVESLSNLLFSMKKEEESIIEDELNTLRFNPM